MFLRHYHLSCFSQESFPICLSFRLLFNIGSSFSNVPKCPPWYQRPFLHLASSSPTSLSNMFIVSLHLFTVLNSKKCSICMFQCIRTLQEDFKPGVKSNSLSSVLALLSLFSAQYICSHKVLCTFSRFGVLDTC